MKRPALTPGRLPRVRRIHSARIAAARNLTHERIAVNLGISPLRLVLLCERHGIEVRRAPGRVRHPPADTAAMDQRVRAETRRNVSEERAESARVDRETFGGYELVQGHMVWRPGKRRVCPAFTTASLYRPNGEPIENVPVLLASLGEVEPEHKPVTPGAKTRNPMGSWGHSGGVSFYPVQRGKVGNARPQAKATKASKRIRAARAEARV